MGMNEGKLKEFYEIASDFDTVMMTTMTTEGFLNSRAMATQKECLPDSDLWFVTSVETSKNHDIETDPRVNISFYQGGDRTWISVAGRAWLEQNPERIKQLWKEDWRIWFPNGPEDKSIGLIHVEALQVNYWQPEGGRIATLFSTAKAYVSGETPHMNPQKSIDLNTYMSG